MRKYFTVAYAEAGLVENVMNARSAAKNGKCAGGFGTVFAVNSVCIATHSNSIYFFSPKTIFSSTEQLRAALNIFLRSPILPMSACPNRESAVLRKTFMFRGKLSFRALAESSRNATSKHQCRLFSIAKAVDESIERQDFYFSTKQESLNF